MIKILINNIRFVNPTSLIRALKRINKYQIEIWGTDTEPKELTPASQFVDHYIVSPSIDNSTEYFTFINQLCNEVKFDLIIPGSDKDVQFYSKYQEFFSSKIILPELSAVELFYNKLNASIDIQNNGYLIPPILDDISGEKKIIFRKKISSSSTGICIFDLTREHMIPNYFNNEYFVQKYIEGDEYTVDMFTDINGAPKLIIPRKRLRIKNGMSVSSKVCNNQSVINLCKQIYSRYYIPGLSNIQFIEKDNNIFFIELNMRFAGSGICGIAASFNYLELYIEHFLFGKDLLSLEYYMSKVAWNSIISRYYDECIFYPNNCESKS